MVFSRDESMAPIYFRSLFDNMSEGVCLHEVIYDAQGTPVNYRILDVNAQYEAILHLPRAAVVGKLATEAYGVANPPYLKEYATVADTGIPYRFETYFPPLDKHFVISVAPIDKGQFATIFFDITELKRAEEKLQSLNQSLQVMNDQLQEAMRAKDEMIQNVSHELRTPLTLIMGHLELLLSGVRGPLTAEQQYSLNVMETQSRRLYFMVSRLLMLRAIDTQGLNKARLDPLPWLARLVEPWQIKAAMANIRLELDLSPTLPAIDADADMLEQVVVNLLDNAFKFSPPQTTIRLGASSVVRNEATQARHWLRLTVCDQGHGIPPDELERVFERFYQVDGGMTRRFGGMGIGLALCQAIVQAHGGRIWAESEGVGKGSTFYVEVPTADAVA